MVRGMPYNLNDLAAGVRCEADGLAKLHAPLLRGLSMTQIKEGSSKLLEPSLSNYADYAISIAYQKL